VSRMQSVKVSALVGFVMALTVVLALLMLLGLIVSIPLIVPWALWKAVRVALRDPQVRFTIEKERLIVSERYRYAGRADLIIEGLERHPDVLDIKTGEAYPSHALQVAAYEWGYRETVNTKRTFGRCILYLRDNGTYRLDRHKSPHDFAVFLAVKQVYDWRQANGS